MIRWGVALLAVLTAIGCGDSSGGGGRDAGEDIAHDTIIDAAEAPRDVVDVAADLLRDDRGALVADGAVDVPMRGESDAGDGGIDGATGPVDVPMDQGPPPCPSGQSRCDGACVDTATATAHCGRCGAPCPTRANAAAACVAGTCRAVCNVGFADCDGEASNGCESALDRPETCRSCGTRCQEPTPLCQESGGSHACVSGCSGATNTRCAMRCADTRTDVRHCGACDHACSAPANARAMCTAGTCAFSCDTGYHACGAACADDTAVTTCGARCEPCPARANATATCNAGSCGFTCFTGFADCDGDASNGCEVETRSSTAHCGSCGRSCAPPSHGNATCAGGTCGVVCDTGFANCDGDASNGCETDLAAETSCGACGTTCASSSRCVRGVCAPCSALAPMAGGRGEVADAVPLRLASGSFTIEAWLFANGYANRCQNAIATKRGSNAADGWFFSVTGNDCGVPAGRLYYQVSGGVDPNVVANTAAPVGRWFHAAATYDAGTRVLTLWQDGAAVGSTTLPPPAATTTAPMYIGNDSDGQPYTWNGYIDELRISSEVRYRGAFTAPPQLERDVAVIALWRFQESTGVAVDASPNGYVARLVMAERVVSAAVCRP